MAVDTIDKKHAVMKLSDQLAAPVIIAETSPLSQGDKQQLLWGYPGILWGEAVPGVSAIYIPTYRRRRR